jgi:hypothetical protein
LISHLQPPVSVIKVRYDRFSPYHQNPQRYGIEIQANHRYASVYPLPPEELEQLAYFFEDVPSQAHRPDRQSLTPGRWSLRQAVDAWSVHFWGPGLPAILSVTDSGERLSFLDTRPVAPQRRCQLEGLARLVYLSCETTQSLTSLLSTLRKRLPEVEEGQVVAVLQDLVQSKLLLCLRERYLALGVHGNLPSLPPMAEFPGGSAKVDERLAEQMGPRPLWPPPNECLTAATKSPVELHR